MIDSNAPKLVIACLASKTSVMQFWVAGCVRCSLFCILMTLIAYLTTPVLQSLYENDLTRHTVIKLGDETFSLQEYMDQLFDWSRKWLLNISYKKCQMFKIVQFLTKRKVIALLNLICLALLMVMSIWCFFIDKNSNFSNNIMSVVRRAYLRERI